MASKDVFWNLLSQFKQILCVADSLKKAVSDSAYLNTIEQLLEEKRSELCELRDYDADR